MTIQTSQPTNTPKFTNWVLTKLLKNRISEEQVGDLFEEYQSKANDSVGIANKWVYRQTVLACLSVISNALTSERFVRYALYTFAIALFSTLILFITWLSNVDEIPSSQIWSRLLEGKVHLLLIDPVAWQSMFGVSSAIFDISMYIHIPSIIWAILSLAGLFYVQKRHTVSTIGFIFMGLATITLPYLWSLAYIATHDLIPKQVGPIIAFGVISALYLIFPVTHRVIVANREHNNLSLAE